MSVTISLAEFERDAVSSALTAHILKLANDRIGLRQSGRAEIDAVIDTLDDVVELLRERA